MYRPTFSAHLLAALIPLISAAVISAQDVTPTPPSAAPEESVFTRPAELVAAKRVTIGGTTMQPGSLPAGLVHDADLGVIRHERIAISRFHAWPPPTRLCEAPRALKTPGGDYLVVYAADCGHTYGNPVKMNDLYARRSADAGKTWTAPAVAYPVPYNQHAWNPLVPRGGTRIYSFSMEGAFDQIDLPHAAPLDMRHSDDDGRTWSEATIIRPSNDPGYKGVCHMQGCELDDGTWLLPTYTPIVDQTGVRCDRQYVLRTTDQGKTWTLLPGKRPHGWSVAYANRLMEGQTLSLGGLDALMLSRESSGHLWEQRSADGGMSWTAPAATSLVHPDAPPMCFRLADRRTLVVFIHNRPATDRYRNAGHPDRQELWACLSTDAGRTWSEPRYLASDACKLVRKSGYNELSYGDLIVDGDDLHFFVDHRKRQILHLRFKAFDLPLLPTRADLAKAAPDAQ